MSDSTVDVAVIGGGPAGLTVAGRVAAAGFTALLFEEDDEIGSPERCSGLVSSKALQTLGLDCPRKLEVNAIKRGELVVPSSGSLEFDLESLGMTVIDRRLYDQCILFDAKNSGAIVNLSERVYGFTLKGDRWEVLSRRRAVNSRIIVDARGAPAYSRGDRRLYAVQLGCFFRRPVEKDKVTVIVDKGYSREYFFWVIPVDEYTAKIGGAGGSPRMVDVKLHSLVEEYGCTIYRSIRSSIVIGGFDGSSKDGLFKVGDSAGQTKPTTGGGAILSVQGAHILSSMLLEYLNGGLQLGAAAERYRRGWEKMYGREESIQRLLRGIYEQMDDGKVWLFAKAIDRSGMSMPADFDRLGSWFLATAGVRLVKELVRGAGHMTFDSIIRMLERERKWK